MTTLTSTIQTQFDRPKVKIICMFLVFAMALGWMVLLTQGFPFADPDDWDHILASEGQSWQLMTFNFLVPWSRAQEWASQINLLDQTTARRLGQGVALKAVQASFGYEPFAYYFFTKTIFFAGTVCLLFLLLVNMTKSYGYALAGVTFFVFVPAYYTHALWISVPETMVHFFTILGITIYLNLIRQLDQKIDKGRYWVWLTLLLVVGWVSMKTKETAIVLPLSLGAMTLCRLFHWRVFNKRIASLILVIGFLAFLLVPIEHIFTHPSPGRPYYWSTVWRMLFCNFGVGLDDETTTAFFSNTDLWPVSIARTIGFYLLWAIVASSVIYWIAKWRHKVSKSHFFLADPLVGISLYWIAIEIALMGFFQPDPRYFSGTLIPITIVSVRVIRIALESFKFPLRTVLTLLVLMALANNLYKNFQHTIWIRQRMGQRAHRFIQTARTIYMDQFPDRKIMTRDFGLYYCPSYLPNAPRPRLRDVVYHAEIGYDALNKTSAGSLDDYERYAREGGVYYVTPDTEKLSGYPHAVLLEKLSGINKGSVFESLLYTLKRKKPRPLYIFKYQ